jgi:sugar/nucleoside kinase (ribokinase family)
MTTHRYDVAALGNAIMDVIAPVDDDFLDRHGIAKARMNLIDAGRCEALYAALPANRVETSGGSAGNTVAGLCGLGARAAFMGKVADDALGAAYRADMERMGAAFVGAPLEAGPATARSIIAVTPDGERSMNTYLGASTEFAPGDVDPATVTAAGWLYLEGYLYDKPAAQAAFVKAAAIAQAAGGRVAVTLSDVFCVERHRAAFRDLVRKHVDLVFANEHELLALYETRDFGEALAALRAETQLAAVTRSEKGSVALRGEEIVEAPALPVERVVDVTGAGDQYAAGFLSALVRGRPLGECARLGHVAAAEVIGHVGPRPQADLRALARAAGLDV